MTRTDEKVSYLPKSKIDCTGAPYTPQTAAADVEATLRILEGRWKLLILFHLFDGKLQRFSDLERAIPAISARPAMVRPSSSTLASAAKQRASASKSFACSAA